MNKPSDSHNSKDQTSPESDTTGATKQTRLVDTKGIFTLLIAQLISGCAYHVRGSNAPHPLEYEHREAIVIFPWRNTDDFHREYELKILPTIAAWIGWPVEVLDGLSRMKFQRMLYIIPAIFHALENDREDIEIAADRAKNNRKAKEQLEQDSHIKPNALAEREETTQFR